MELTAHGTASPRPTVGEARRRGLWAATWLGWQVETNWTHPAIYLLYSVLRPLGISLILYLMYRAVGRHDGHTHAVLVYALTGNALWTFVMVIVSGLNQTVLDDREHYQMIRYLWIAPLAYPLYLVGRALGLMVISAGTSTLLLTVSLLLLGQGINVSAIDVPLLLVSMLCGLAAVVAIGLMLAAIALRVSRHAYAAGEAVASALFLVSGAVFPVTILPHALRLVSSVFPLTYWLDGVRMALFGPTAVVDGSHPGTPAFYLELISLTAVTCVVGVGIINVMLRSAQRKGVLDRGPTF